LINTENESEHIVGQSIFLRPPTRTDASEGPWFSWFNDPESTRFTQHGEVPNTRAAQIKFFETAMADESRLLYAICDTQTRSMVGVTSIQSIDLLNREAEIAIMIGEKSHRQRGVSIEAWGLLTQHAFETLPLERIYAGSHEGLRRWVDSLRVIGYEMDSEKSDGFVKDGQMVGVLLYSCHRSRFEELIGKRGRFNAENWLNATEGD